MSEQKFLKLFPYLTLSFTVLLAWLPVLNKYQPFSEDYLYTSLGLFGYFRLHGLWRLIGHGLVIFSTLHPMLFGVLAISAHLITVCLFFKVCQRLLGDISISLILSLLAGIFPWGHQAMVWSPAFAFVLATTFFWANLLILIRFSRKNDKQFFCFATAYCLTWLSLLCFEGLLFSFAVSGCIAWIHPGKLSLSGLRQRIVKFYSGWAPLAGCLSFVVSQYVVRLYLPSYLSQKTLVWNPESIFSVYFYQWSNIHIFQPWFNPVLRKFVFYGWNNGMGTAAILIATLVVGSLFFFMKRLSREEPSSPKPGLTLLFYIVLLLLGASMIYAIGGGYSLDNRKRYPIIFLLLLLFGWIWRNFLKPKIKVSNKSLLFLVALGAIGITTTWLNTGIWQYEAMRYNSLVDFLVANNIGGNVRIEWEPDLYKAWPTLSQTWGARMDEEGVLNPAIIYKGGQPVHATQNIKSKVARFDSTASKWRLAS